MASGGAPSGLVSCPGLIGRQQGPHPSARTTLVCALGLCLWHMALAMLCLSLAERTLLRALHSQSREMPGSEAILRAMLLWVGEHEHTVSRKPGQGRDQAGNRCSLVRERRIWDFETEKGIPKNTHSRERGKGLSRQRRKRDNKGWTYKARRKRCVPCCPAYLWLPIPSCGVCPGRVTRSAPLSDARNPG